MMKDLEGMKDHDSVIDSILSTSIPVLLGGCLLVAVGPADLEVDDVTHPIFTSALLPPRYFN